MVECDCTLTACVDATDSGLVLTTGGPGGVAVDIRSVVPATAILAVRVAGAAFATDTIRAGTMGRSNGSAAIAGGGLLRSSVSSTPIGSTV
jgi:hypothetical protein